MLWGDHPSSEGEFTGSRRQEGPQSGRVENLKLCHQKLFFPTSSSTLFQAGPLWVEAKGPWQPQAHKHKQGGSSPEQDPKWSWARAAVGLRVSPSLSQSQAGESAGRAEGKAASRGPGSCPALPQLCHRYWAGGAEPLCCALAPLYF